ncbi:decaprenyl-phosphate phosphoribosyltransferase [Candidatus Gracilibacteria bacterium]|nr:decaprenyl-phosphate phosphoribosyltransferase [Candidatus Gracilibacteria bacterium]
MLSFKIFLLFCLFVGSTYIINDYFDIDRDKKHPKKSKRPLASGKLNKYFALILSILILLLIPLVTYYNYSLIILALFLLYLINSIFYSTYIKNIVILDVFSIAIGFVIRGLIGTYIINVELSYWFIIMLFFGSLLLGFLKRYQEVKLGIDSRKNIKEYNEEFLKQIVSMITTVLLLSYALYTFQSIQNKFMIYTLPIVSFGIIRYYYNIFFLNKFDNSIEEIIFDDKFLLGSIIIYFGVVFFILSVL